MIRAKISIVLDHDMNASNKETGWYNVLDLHAMDWTCWTRKLWFVLIVILFILLNLLAQHLSSSKTREGHLDGDRFAIFIAQ